MAIYYARKSGNVNAADVWATTPTGVASDVFSSFTNQDTLVSNNFTITLNVNTTVAEIRNDATGGATSGGTFNLSAGVTINANVFTGAGSCISVSFLSPLSANINGNINGGNTNNTGAIYHNGTGTINIIGNAIGGTGGSYSIGVWNNSSGTINIVGNCIGGSGGNSSGILSNGSGTINITGTVMGGSGSVGVILQSNTSGTITIIGTINGGGVQTLTGGLGTINVTGNVNGSSGIGINNTGNTTINIVGVATGQNSVGISNTSNGVVTITRAKGNGFGNGSTGLTSQVGVSSAQTGSVRVYEIEYGTLGQSPTSGPIELIGSTSNVAVFATRLGLPKTLVDLNNATNLVPTSGNVRSGTSYNYGNNIGSCVIPNPNSVVYGVSVDNTVGSGLLSPVAVWNALTSSIGSTGSIGERLKNVSTVSTVGKQLEGVL